MRDSDGRWSLRHQAVRESLQARAGPSANVADPGKTVVERIEHRGQPCARSRTIGGGERSHPVFQPSHGKMTQENRSPKIAARFILGLEGMDG